MSAATFAGVAIGVNFSRAEAVKESSKNFSNFKNSYDAIISSGDIGGVFAALQAARRGLNVLLIERRPYLGGDITAKRRLWLGAEEFEIFNAQFGEIFFPKGEAEDAMRKLENQRAENDDDVLLFAGSLKKSLLRTVINNGIDVLFMTETCGIFTDAQNSVAGILAATKHGVFAIQTQTFIDASDNNLFSRRLFNSDFKIKSANFVLELEDAEISKKRTFKLTDTLPILTAHCAKRCDTNALLEFNFECDTNDVSQIERKARALTREIGKNFVAAKELSAAKIRWTADETSLSIEGKIPSPDIENFKILDASLKPDSCANIVKIAREAGALADSLKKLKAHSATRLKRIDGDCAADFKFENQIDELGKFLPLCPFDIAKLSTENVACDVLVAGCGTAGTYAAKSAAARGAKVVALEYFNGVGGTKTMGGVVGYYWGNKTSSLFKETVSKLNKTVKNNKLKQLVAIQILRESEILDANAKLVTGAIICGAQVKPQSNDKRRLEKLFACIGGKLISFSAPVTIDATADADIANFASENFELGDKRSGITQNYSQWPLLYAKKGSKFDDMYCKDLDLLDTTLVCEFQRGLLLSHYEGSFYDIQPQITVRESRLPQGEYRVTLADMTPSKAFKDTICQAHSDFDPHHFSHSEISRCAMVAPHFETSDKVNIPYRAIVPKHVDGLLFSGRGISVSHLVLQFTRMSADVEMLGYVTGEIAAECAKTKVSPRDFDVSNLQADWIEKGFMPKDFSATVPYSPREIAEKLAAGDESFLLRACVKTPAEMLPHLIAQFEKSQALPLCKALCWFGDNRGYATVAEDLKASAKLLEDSPNAPDYCEVYARGNLKSPYWLASADIAFLALPQKNAARDEILEISKKATTGGNISFPKKKYYANRIDLCLVPNFNLLLNIAFYVERNPSKDFAIPLEKLLDSPQLSRRKSKNFDTARWNAYHANLALALAAAAARCGSKKAMYVLGDYLDDTHAFFRRFAHKELCAATNADGGFDAQRWRSIIDESSPSLSPLAQTCEL